MWSHTQVTQTAQTAPRSSDLAQTLCCPPSSLLLLLIPLVPAWPHKLLPDHRSFSMTPPELCHRPTSQLLLVQPFPAILDLKGGNHWGEGRGEAVPSSSTDLCLAKEAVQLQSHLPSHTISAFYLSPLIPKISGVICLLLPLSHTLTFFSISSFWHHLLGACRVSCLQHTSQQSSALHMDPWLWTRNCMTTGVTAPNTLASITLMFPFCHFGLHSEKSWRREATIIGKTL